jgi:branched-chain amino acid transport system ATP-binding protein
VGILEVRGLTKRFGGLAAVTGLSLDVGAGELLGIIGPNGAGKTTFFRLISGEVAPTSGRIWFKEREVTGMPQHAIARLGVAKSYQITSIFPHLTVFENVRVAAQGAGQAFDFWRRAEALTDARARADEMLTTVGLTSKANQLATFLSHGEKRHLELAIALAANPVLLLLDEPTAGMSRAESKRAVELIRDVTQGKTLVMVEHDMSVVFDLADRISVLVYGQVIASGTPAEIRANDAVREAYLGQQPEAA